MGVYILIKTTITWKLMTGMSRNFQRFDLKVGTIQKPYVFVNGHRLRTILRSY